jgi:hypothetical protein
VGPAVPGKVWGPRSRVAAGTETPIGRDIVPHARTDGAPAPTTIIAQAIVPPSLQASSIAHFPLLKIDRPSPVGHHDGGS